MKNFLKKSLKYILPLIVGFLIGILINIPSCGKQPEPKTEFIEKHDTIAVEKERVVYKTKIEYVDRIDTFYVKESGDTVRLDSLPIEHKCYEDTIKTDSTSTEIKIEYSGFNAEINNVWLRHNYFEKQTTIIKEPKRVGWIWYVGFDVGFGGQLGIKDNIVDFNYGPQAGIHVGVGIGGTIK